MGLNIIIQFRFFGKIGKSLQMKQNSILDTFAFLNTFGEHMSKKLIFDKFRFVKIRSQQVITKSRLYDFSYFGGKNHKPYILGTMQSRYFAQISLQNLIPILKDD